MSYIKAVAALTVGLALFTGPLTQAAAYSAVYVFGDSLSDNGNFFALTGGGLPQAPYFNGRFSNGPAAVERMTSAMGAPLRDYAVGGAGTGLTNTEVLPTAPPALYNTGMLSQVQNFQAGLTAPADAAALYFVWGGSNDFIHGDLSTPASRAALITSVITNLNTAVASLYVSGARKFLLPTLPDLGLTPLALSLGPAQAAGLTAISAAFDAALAASYGGLLASLPGAGFTVFDTFGAQHQLLANAPALGFTNTTQGCFTGFVGVPGTVCSTPGSYLYWDDRHPTASVNQILGAQLLASIPEPASAGLVGLGLLLASWRRRA